MLTLQQLVQLNRELRHSLAVGWANHIGGPNDGKFWPLLHLAVQVMRKHEALELLAERGLGQEAGMMLRSMFEATVNAVWISQDLDDRLKRYHAYQFFSVQQYRNLAEKRRGIARRNTENKENESKKTIKQIAEEAGWREMGKYGFKRNDYWSGKPLKRMAEDIGWLERYETIYKIYSDITHAGAASGRDYFSQSDSGVTFITVGPQWEHCQMCLMEGYLYLTTTFTVADDCVDLGLGKQLDTAMAILPKIFPGSPDIMRGSKD